jgi:hypothetical protein
VSRWLGVWRGLLGLEDPPESFTGRLQADERVLGSATVSGDGGVVVVATSYGVWLPKGRRIGWHLVSKASWGSDTLTLVEASEDGTLDDAVLLVDRAPLHLTLVDPGRVPEIVHKRVTWSIKARHRVELPGGGAWFLLRVVPGENGVSLQVRADPGTDVEALRRILPEAACTLNETPR